MSLILATGFDVSAARDPNIAIAIYQNRAGANATPRFANGKAANLNNNDSIYWHYNRDTNANAPSDTYTIGYAVRINNNYPGTLMMCLDGNGSTLHRLQYDAVSQRLQWADANSSLYQASTMMPLGQWVYVEMQFQTNVSNGRGIMRMDGVTVFDSGANFYVANFAMAKILFTGMSPTTTADFTDFYVLDSSGSNNTFLGDCRVEHLPATAQGAHNDWVRTGGSSALDAMSSVDGDTSYLRSEVLGQQESFALADLASSSGTVAGVCVNVVAKKETTNPVKIQGIARINATDYLSTLKGSPAQSGYYGCQAIFEVNPATGAPWTAAEVNALEAGFQLST